MCNVCLLLRSLRIFGKIINGWEGANFQRGLVGSRIYFVADFENLALPVGRFLIVQSTSVCAGWYAALVNDFMSHGRFAHMLYMNGPSVLKAALLDESGNVVYTRNESMVPVYIGEQM